MDLVHAFVLALLAIPLGLVTGYGYGHRSGFEEARDRFTRKMVRKPFRG